jgi:hypothetical protein
MALRPFHRHSGMVRKHQTRNLEIPDRRFASSGMTVKRLYAEPIKKEGPREAGLRMTGRQPNRDQAVLV